MKKGAFRVGGLLVVLVLVAFFKFIYLSDVQGDSNAAVEVDKDLRSADATNRSTASIHGYSVDYDKIPASTWLINERNRAASYLARNDVVMLIVPVQGDKNAFDPVERALITRLLDDRLKQLGANYVADAGQVLQYLGSNRTTFSPADIRRLATMVNAEKILVLRAEHDRTSKWSINATLKTSNGTTEDETKTWSDLTFSDSNPPSAAFITILKDVAKFATNQRVELTRVNPKFDVDRFELPASLDDLIARSAESPLHAAAYLQLLGALHPRGEFDESRDSLFERSLVELEKVSPDTPFYRYFKARAYAYLDRRPAALAVLGDPVNRYENALLAALNGDQPSLRSYVSSDDTSVLRFMALKDMQILDYWYGSKRDYSALAQFTQTHAAWAPLLFRSLRDYDDRADYSAATLVYALQNLVPGELMSLEDYYEKLAVVGDSPDELDLTRLLWKQIEALEKEAVKEKVSEASAASTVSMIDILELVKSLSVANHLHMVEWYLKTSADPVTANDEINRFESFYSGHPAITLLQGRVLEAMSKKSAGDEKINLLAASESAQANGFAWTGRLSPNAVEVARAYSRIFRLGVAYHPGFDSEFSRYSRRYFEWPKSTAWYRNIQSWEAEDGAFQHCIDYTWTAFECLRWKIEADIEKSDDPDVVRSELLAKYANRFLGHPKRDEYAVELTRRSGDKDAEIRHILSKIEAGSTDLSLYYSLGLIFKIRGDYRKAQEIFLSYPNFQASGNALSATEETHADSAAASLYWIGQYELARPLLELAANSGSGSSASMISAERIALLDGDLELAANLSANRVRRDGSKYGLRDFLELIHILGESELAWKTLDQFQAVTQDSQMWSGVLVGHRMESTTIEQIVAWVQSSDSRRAAEVRDRIRNEPVCLAPRYLLLAGTMDRVPNSGFAAQVASVYPRQRPSYQHRITVPTKTNGLEEPVNYDVVRDGQYEFKHDPLVAFPQVIHRVQNKTEVDHRYTMLAGAMSAFLAEDYANAFKRFNETAYYYDLGEYLAYYAFTAAMAGQSEHLHVLLAKRDAEFQKDMRTEQSETRSMGYRFDEDLTYAALAALSGEHDQAIIRLRMALNNRPYLEDRSIYPMYEIVDLADRFFERTGEEVYRDFALDLARRHTVILPMYSWAYFVVAKYGQSDVERVEAAASGLYLDPLSHRATKLDKKLLDDAKELLRTNGSPFAKRNRDAETQST